MAGLSVADVFERTRRNHGLEHATVGVLIQRLGPTIRLVARSTPRGFYIYGQLPTEAVRAAVDEALARLRAGEAELAVSPLCGTNIAVAGLLAGLSSVAMASAARRPLDRLVGAVVAGTFAVLLAQPLGRLAQAWLTTSADMRGLRVRRVERFDAGRIPVHWVETEFAGE
jgi:predicted transcriptional regulator